MLVVEHNLDVIKTADWVIDLGPMAARGAVACWWRGRPKLSPRARSRTRGVP